MKRSFNLLSVSICLLTSLLGYSGTAAGKELEGAPCGFVGSDCSDGPHLSFSGGEKSVDALIDKFFAALEAKDLEKLNALRVTQAEFQQIVVPGMFKPGEKPKYYSPEVQKYFWEDVNHKTRFYAENLIKNFGGRAFASRVVSFSKPTQEYAWYRAYGELRVVLENPPALPEELATGTIVEFEGRYKFISYNYD